MFKEVILANIYRHIFHTAVCSTTKNHINQVNSSMPSPCMLWHDLHDIQRKICFCSQAGGLLQITGKQNMINSSSPSDTYMCQWIGSALAQIMACHLVGTKPLSKPGLLSIGPLVTNFNDFFFYQNTKLSIKKKCIWKYCLWWPFCLGEYELTLQVPVPSMYGTQTLPSLGLLLGHLTSYN